LLLDVRHGRSMLPGGTEASGGFPMLAP
jgi:hypothetical protein